MDQIQLTNNPVGQVYVDNVRQMRIVYTISALAVLFAIALIIVASLIGAQVNPNPNATINGLTPVLTTYQTSNNPLQSGSIILSTQKTKLLCFTDNLYLVDLQQEKSNAIWAASPQPTPYNAFLTLSSSGTLEIQVINGNGNRIVLWTNGVKETQVDNYLLQVIDAGQIQILNSSLAVVWSQP